MNNDVSNTIDIKWGFIYKKDKKQIIEKIGKVNLQTNKKLLLFVGEENSGIHELTNIFYEKNNLFYINSVINKEISPVFFYKYGVNFFNFRSQFVLEKTIKENIFNLFIKNDLLKIEKNKKIVELKDSHYSQNNEILKNLNEILEYEKTSWINSKSAIKLWETYKKRLEKNNNEISNNKYFLEKNALESNNQKEITKQKSISNKWMIKNTYLNNKKKIDEHKKELALELKANIHNKFPLTRKRELTQTIIDINNIFISFGIVEIRKYFQKLNKTKSINEKTLRVFYKDIKRIFEEKKPIFSKLHIEKLNININYFEKLINPTNILNYPKFIEFEKYVYDFSNSKIIELKKIIENINNYLLYINRKLVLTTDEIKIKSYKKKINSLNYEVAINEELKNHLEKFLIEFEEYKKFITKRNYNNIFKLFKNTNKDLFLFLYSLNIWKIDKKNKFYKSENQLKKQLIEYQIKKLQKDNKSIKKYFFETRSEYNNYQKEIGKLGRELLSTLKNDVYFKEIIFVNNKFTLKNPHKEIKQIKTFYSKNNQLTIFEEKLIELDSIFKIKDILNKNYSEITKFERIKINLINLIFLNYRFIVFDDNFLDFPEFEQKKINDMVKKISEIYDLKIIFSFTKKSDMKRLKFDEVFVIKGARIMEWGSYENIMKSPYYEYTMNYLNNEYKYETYELSENLSSDIETIFFYDEYKNLSFKKISKKHFILMDN